MGSKIRKIASIEKGLEDVLRTLNEREIKEVMREASIKKAARERRKKYLNG